MEATFRFELVAADRASRARAGIIRTPHGDVPTPHFLPVGTAAAVKTLTPAELRQAGVKMVLGNTYHLLHEPGAEVIRSAGGLARFMAWDEPTLTDSGGFQVLSLSDTRTVTDAGVQFRSVYDGRLVKLTPQLALEVQLKLGSDVIYALDDCPPYPAERGEVERALRLTAAWARVFMSNWKAERERGGGEGVPFLIVQGGVWDDLRRLAVEDIAALDPYGFGIGGVAVGEPRDDMLRITDLCCAALPPELPRHLLGVGTPTDLLDAVALGIDLFDCVLPTRNGRNGQAFTTLGTLNLRNAAFRADGAPLDDTCDCYTCRTFTRGYLHHLLVTGEMLAARLLTLHNLTFYENLLRQARQAIVAGEFGAWRRQAGAQLSGAAAPNR